MLEIINEQKEGISFQMLHQMLKSTYYLRPHYKGDWNQFADKMGNGALNFAYNMNEEALRTLLEKHLTAAKRNIEVCIYIYIYDIELISGGYFKKRRLEGADRNI